jgi:arylformamidase
MLHDVTRPLYDGHPVWPGDEPCRIAWGSRMDRGDLVNAALLHAPVHVGTHADGPFHTVAGGERLAELSLEAFLGPARVVDARGRALDAAWARRVLAAGVPERLLVYTGAWTDPGTMPTDFAAPDGEAARILAASGIRLFGTDAPSIDPFGSTGLPAHAALLGARIVVIENLLLDGVPPGEYELVALPLRLRDADSSPVRALLRPLAG